MHFEQLWEMCEKLHKDSKSDDVVGEILMKLQLYKMLTKQENIKDLQESKERLLGEIIFSLTKLSLKDNIDVFQSLATAYKFHATS